MNYFTATIPPTLAEKLEEKGMMVDIDCDTFDEGTQYQRDEVWCNTTYAEVFDWLMSEKGLVLHIWAGGDEHTKGNMIELGRGVKTVGGGGNFLEAAEQAIEKALELI